MTKKNLNRYNQSKALLGPVTFCSHWISVIGFLGSRPTEFSLYNPQSNFRNNYKNFRPEPSQFDKIDLFMCNFLVLVKEAQNKDFRKVKDLRKFLWHNHQHLGRKQNKNYLCVFKQILFCYLQL